MKAVGIARRVDQLGRVVLPKELRDTLDMKPGDPIEMYPDGELLYMKKYLPECIFCESTEEVLEYKEKIICKKCIKELKRL
jgi:transcriptional pleiotropic regulator of transition state genes